MLQILSDTYQAPESTEDQKYEEIVSFVFPAQNWCNCHWALSRYDPSFVHFHQVNPLHAEPPVWCSVRKYLPLLFLSWSFLFCWVIHSLLLVLLLASHLRERQASAFWPRPWALHKYQHAGYPQAPLRKIIRETSPCSDPITNTVLLLKIRPF